MTAWSAEGFQQGDLPISEGLNFRTSEANSANSNAPAKQRHNQGRPITDLPCQLTPQRILVRFGEVLDLNNPCL
jgi:hypothetical protein